MVTPTATFPMWNKTTKTKPTPTSGIFPTWQKPTVTDTYDTQIDAFNKHLEEFYHQDRGDQTYLDFLGETYPESSRQLTSDFVTAINQIQPELLGTQADFLKAHPVEETFLDKLKGLGGEALGAVTKVLQYGLYPFTAIGMAIREYGGLQAGETEALTKLLPLTEEEEEKFREVAEPMAVHPEFKIKEWLPGGEKYKEYQELPWYEQLAYEAPAWIALIGFLPSATSLRAGLSGVTGAGKIPATIARGALAPVAGVESVMARAVTGLSSKVAQAISKVKWARYDKATQGRVLGALGDTLRANPKLQARATPEALSKIASGADDLLRASRVREIRWATIFKEWGITKYPSSVITNAENRALNNYIKWGLEFASPAKTDASIRVLRGIGYTTEAIGKMTVNVAWESIVTKLGITGAIKALLDVYEPELAKVLTEAAAGEPFTATVYRGVKAEGAAPTDEGLVGKAEYWTTDPKYAATYGTVTESQVTLDNPLVIGSQREWDDFAMRTRELRDTAVAEDRSEDWVQTELRNQLEAEGYDGVVIAEGIVESGKQVAVFYPERAGVTAPEYAPTTAMAEWETVSGEVPTADAKKLRQSIMATVKTKGLSESKYRALFKKVGETRNLTEMGADKLTKVLDAVREARPIKIQGKNVITAKTEKAIQTLKDILIAEKKLTPEIYENLKKYLDLTTDKYESRELFITERQARSLIRQMNIEGEVGLTKWDVLVSEGLANKPELRTSIDGLTKRIVSENKPKPKKGITIPFRKVASEISEFPDDVGLSGTMSILRALRRFQEQLGGREVTRIYETAEMKVEQRRLNEITLANTVNAMKMEVPQLATIIKDKTKMARIQQWLDSDLKIAKIEKPDLPADELEVAKLFRSRYDQWKNAVRLERFKDAYYHYGGRAKEVVADLIKNGTEGTSDVAIPDAPLKDIKEAIGIYETQGETALRVYLDTKDWGVLKSGYSFSQILHPKLRMYRGVTVRATTTSLHQRKGLDFLRDERTAWERLIAYERQMIGLNLQPYYRKMDTEFRKAVESGRISPESAKAAANKISQFMREVKGFPIESPVIALILRIGGWSFGTLAKVPWMSVRNLHQNIAFHPDKSEIVKSFFGRGFFSNPLTKRGRLDYTDALVHQYKGVQQEQILMGYMGKTPIENLIRKTDYYHLSDKANRYMSMNGSGAKAEIALKQYLKDKDATKFLKNSGANELSATEQVRILEYLALETYDYGGVLSSVSGGEAAIRDIASRITTLNHFNYVRYLRSAYEMGEMGRIIGSLVAFPRSVVERYVDIFSRIKRLGGADRKRAIHALLAMAVGSAIASLILKELTGKERDAYNPLLIMQWQLGGLAIGATQNLMELYRLITNLTFAEDEGQKKYYFDELALRIPQLGDSFIPFYSVTMNLLESLTDSKYLDRKWLRQIREVVDKNYELNDEFYQIERDWLERAQHGLFGTNTPDPSDLEQALKRLGGTEELLGQVDREELDKARQKAEEDNKPFEYTEADFIYRTNDLGSDISSATYGLDPSEIIKENGFSPLVLQYLEYQEMKDDYFDVPADKRYDYREKNPEVDANLFFWSYVTTLQSDRAEQIVSSMVREFNIPANAIKGYQKIFGGEFPGWGETETTGTPSWGTPESGGFPTWGK